VKLIVFIKFFVQAPVHSVRLAGQGARGSDARREFAAGVCDKGVSFGAGTWFDDGKEWE
jgi:hypothetical protein